MLHTKLEWYKYVKSESEHRDALPEKDLGEGKDVNFSEA